MNGRASGGLDGWLAGRENGTAGGDNFRGGDSVRRALGVFEGLGREAQVCLKRLDVNKAADERFWAGSAV